MTSLRLVAASRTGTSSSKDDAGSNRVGRRSRSVRGRLGGGPSSEPARLQSEDELSLVAHRFVGEFFWSSAHSGTLLDFERLELRPDGTYVAKVEATLLNPGVRSFRFPCTLPEQGRWNAYDVSGHTRIRVLPTTSRARIYVATMIRGHLSLARRGQRTMLFLADRLSLAAADSESEMWTGSLEPAPMDDEESQSDIVTTCR